MRTIQYVPFLIVWGIWRSRNDRIFEEKYTPIFSVTMQVMAMYKDFVEKDVSAKVCIMKDLIFYGKKMQGIFQWSL